MFADVDLVLFDLGSVLVQFDSLDTLRKLTGSRDDDWLRRRWLTAPAVRSFETGGCTAIDFGSRLVEEWNLPIEPEDFLREFARWPRRPLPGAEELVMEVQAKVATGCFSNTNALHWDSQISDWPLAQLFEHRFLSYELGAVKPDVEAFERVAELLSVDPNRVLFLDDIDLNVEGARLAGFQAAQTVGVEEVRACLATLGLIAR